MVNYEIFLNPRAGMLGTGAAPINPAVAAFHESLPDYQQTPLLSLPKVAARLGVARVYLKDESWRLGLPSFKMLGASWACAYAVTHAWGPENADAETLDDLRGLVAKPWSKRLVAATDGNHGRGVARMARYLGMRCLIFVPRGLARSRIRAIRSEGARVKIVDGSYDDAIARSAREADENSLVVSDTSWDGYQDIPQQVTVGYSTLFAEIDRALEAGGLEGPSVVVLQAGVGSFAAAGMVHYRSGSRPTPARTVIVEPLDANCLYRSCQAGTLTEAPPPHRSTMAGLNCGLPSQLTWPVLDRAVDAFVGISDQATYDAMRELADAGVVAGESGAAGLGALLAVANSGTPGDRVAVGLGPDATVLIVNTEGATDPVNYRRVVGVKPATIQAQHDHRRARSGVVVCGSTQGVSTP